ncbi:pirin family protein [soil metagenome]
MLRKVISIQPGLPQQMGELTIHQPLPSSGLQDLDPFLLLHHLGPKFMEKGNQGLPFGPHPHRGFEAVSFIFKGSVLHHDSRGNKSTISDGGVQWMTAGMGIIHSENLSKEMQANGGPLELIQLWINLPAHLKMTQPVYQGFQKTEIPVVTSFEDKNSVNVIAGNYKTVKGPVNSITGIMALTIELEKGGKFHIEINSDQSILIYILSGLVTVNGTSAGALSLIQIGLEGTEIIIKANSSASLLFCTGKATHENIVQHGPFVMNSTTEIMEAMRDYKLGKMGILIEE